MSKIDVLWSSNSDFHSTPFKANKHDAGTDLSAAVNVELPPFMWVNVNLGVSVCVPPGYFYLLLPRSSVFFKHKLVAGPPGVIDAGYTGGLFIPLFNTTNQTKFIKQGERIAQVVVLPVVETNFIFTVKQPHTERGNNGFGSSGR